MMRRLRHQVWRYVVISALFNLYRVVLVSIGGEDCFKTSARVRRVYRKELPGALRRHTGRRRQQRFVSTTVQYNRRQ